MTSALAVPTAPSQGSQSPRILVHPPRAWSDGPAAVELAAQAGLVLDPWQALVLETGCGRRPDGKYVSLETAIVVGRQNGKNVVVEARELAGLFLFGERLILHSAQNFNTAKESFLRIAGLIESTPHLRARLKTNGIRYTPTDLGIELHDGARLRFIARTGISGRGMTADCVILDEAFQLAGDAMSALLPTLSARPDPQVWYTSSAAMATSEQLHHIRSRALSDDPGTLAYLEWSAVEDCATDDLESWAAANPALGIRIPLDFIRAERDALPEAEFRRERLGIPDAPTGAAAIPFGAWMDCKDRRSTAEGRLVFAIDVAYPDRESATIAVAGLRSDGVAHVEVVDHRPGTDWVVPRLAELAKRWRPGALIIDPGSPAGSFARDLADAKIEPRLVTAREYAQACGAFYDAVVKKPAGLRHLGQPELDAAVTAATKRPLGEAWAWDRKLGASMISPLVASTLAFWGLSSRRNSSRVVSLEAALAQLDEESSDGSPGQPDTDG